MRSQWSKSRKRSAARTLSTCTIYLKSSKSMVCAWQSERPVEQCALVCRASLQTFAPSRPADLKACVRTVFSQFGPIVDVVAKKTYKLRGQAWVVFERAEDAERAIKLMQGFPFYGQALVRCWSVLRWLHWSVCLGPGS